jgi:hypothetical protein
MPERGNGQKSRQARVKSCILTAVSDAANGLRAQRERRQDDQIRRQVGANGNYCAAAVARIEAFRQKRCVLRASCMSSLRRSRPIR